MWRSREIKIEEGSKKTCEGGGIKKNEEEVGKD